MIFYITLSQDSEIEWRVSKTAGIILLFTRVCAVQFECKLRHNNCIHTFFRLDRTKQQYIVAPTFTLNY